MALVVTFEKAVEQVSGSERTTYGTLAMDSLYPTNGEPFTARQFGLSRLFSLHVCPSQGFLFEVDYTARKLKAFYADADAASDGPLIECANNTNLAALTAVRWEASGIMTRTTVTCMFCHGEIRYHWQLVFLHAKCKPPLIERAARAIVAPPAPASDAALRWCKGCQQYHMGPHSQKLGRHLRRAMEKLSRLS
jgi:hypothetical protein